MVPTGWLPGGNLSPNAWDPPIKPLRILEMYMHLSLSQKRKGSGKPKRYQIFNYLTLTVADLDCFYGFSTFYKRHGGFLRRVR